MTTYYYELQRIESHGRIIANDDEKAVLKARAKETENNKLVLLYKESDTKNGEPFITVFEDKSLPVI